MTIEEKVLELKQTGLRKKQIAQQLGLTVEQVEEILKHLEKNFKHGLKSVVSRQQVSLQTAVNRLTQHHLVEHAVDRYATILQTFDYIQKFLEPEAKMLNIKLDDYVLTVIKFWQDYREKVMVYEHLIDFYEKILEILITLLDDNEWDKLITRLQTINEIEKAQYLTMLRYIFKNRDINYG